MTDVRREIPQKEKRRLLGLLPPGAAPGRLRQAPDAKETVVTVTRFNADSMNEEVVASASGLKDAWREQAVTGMTWVDVTGLKDLSILKQVAEEFSLPALAMEDVTSTHQRAKVEDYDDMAYVVIRLPWNEGEEIRYEQISFFVGETFVISFQEVTPDAFSEVRARLRKPMSKVRTMGADFFAYALMDCIVDHYMPIMHAIENKIDTMEDDVFSQSAHDVMPSLLLTRRSLAYLRRAAKPLQGALSAMLNNDSDTFGDETKIYLRDTLDHINRVLDNIESDREVCASLMDVHLSVASQRLNEVMKVLTIISVTFIPLSFIAGLYGMNFDTKHPANMPELAWPHGYWFALGLMATSTVAFIGYFWRKGWLFGNRA